MPKGWSIDLPPSAATLKRLTFVTIVFEAEYDLLDLQAHSMAIFIDPREVDEIIVVDNSHRLMSSSRRSSLRLRYGPHASSVRFVDGRQVADVPPSRGWRNQQVLKIAASREVAGDHYLVLDAKNHFVRQSGLDTFAGKSGRPRANFHPFQSHPLRNSLEAVLDYFELDLQPRIARFTSTATPFILVSEVCRSLIRDIEGRSNGTFAGFFLNRNFTEFFLYSAWLEAHGVDLDELYDAAGIDNQTIWPRGRDPETVKKTINRAEDSNSHLLSVHRTALARMGLRATQLVISFWVSRGMFEDRFSAWMFIAKYRYRYIVAMVAKKVREIGVQG